jgi:Putative polyhydroxyalkanoic acid system protein (PHA_gran_rgn)
MSNVTVSIPHQLTRAEAKLRIKYGVSKLYKQGGSPLSNLKESWTGDTLDFSGSALGQTFTGRLFVEDKAVRIEVALPAFFSMLADVLKPTIEQSGRQLLQGPKRT